MSTSGSDTVAGVPILGLNAPTVFLNNKNIAVVTDAVEIHENHYNVTLASGSPNVFAHNLNVARETDLASCEHPIDSGSMDVFSNELGVARV